MLSSAFVLPSAAPPPCASGGFCEKQVCIKSAANLAGHVDSWPRKPAPESWVKFELGGALVCKTEKHENNASPRWDRCCFVHGSHSHSEYVFSVFDGDYSSEEGDWLGTAVLPANATAGVYELPLAGGEFEPQEGTLLIEIPLAPPPPPPPADDRAKQLKYDVSSKLLLDSAKGGEGEERKFLCIMSASGLVETDFYPRVGKSRYPDSWVKISSLTDETAMMGMGKQEIVDIMESGDQSAKDELYRRVYQFQADVINKVSAGQIRSDPSNEDVLDEEHNARPGAEPKYECATGTVSNSLEPNWSFCCDVTAFHGRGLLLELYDEDSLYFVNDFLGANMMGQKTLQDGQYQLPLLSGIIGHTHKPAYLNVLVATSAMPPVANVGEDCWEACGERGGHCPGFCGALGACCKQIDELVHEPGCPDHGIDPYWHSCVVADLSAASLAAEPAALSQAAPGFASQDKGASGEDPRDTELLTPPSLPVWTVTIVVFAVALAARVFTMRGRGRGGAAEEERPAIVAPMI